VNKRESKKLLLRYGDKLDHYSSKGVGSCIYTIQKVRAAAVRQYQSTGQLKIADLWGEALPRINETVRDGLIVSHLSGYEASVQLYTDSKIKLSAFDRTIKTLKSYHNLSDVQLEIIGQEYGKYASTITGEIGTTLERNAQEAVSKIVSENMHVREGVQTLRAAFDKSGVTPQHKGLLETLVRTNMQVAFSTARWQIMSEPAIDEILWGYEYFTAGDGDVRPSHAALDGVTLPKDDPRWQEIWPPNGFRCRCQVIELFEAAKKKEIPEDGGADKGWDFNAGERMKALENTMPAA
jgi:SPP1 gp7 family putative phage head morphogenesis protein